ncbi:Hypothetical protein SMAX5B_000141 [Scophthalmus maximus]|uniref:Uncharacterized protein n=1 Tax=Scophthalmus maximus TaxID=52904 RepID=A0A2U9CUM2_SCOMX|nr:Hypothetical protein SMAX5B_000141 [Scophthalmus maximus]
MFPLRRYQQMQPDHSVAPLRTKLDTQSKMDVGVCLLWGSLVRPVQGEDMAFSPEVKGLYSLFKAK